MIGVLIVTHGDFGKELLKSAELIIGKQNRTMTLGLFHGDSVDSLKDNISKAIDELNEGDGVLIFVDLYGGSPSNAAAMNLKKNIMDSKVECITGVNLPMILEALTMRASYTLSRLKEHCIEIGHLGIKDLYQQIYPTEESIKKVADGR
ncbi:MAG TPA: PTS sugar transporter subunit IIA [Thermoanaerobacterales bacterium]|nr:PTS sugar transporter subunit IIA [Thermoanaerobacterales bacterium]